MPNVLLLAGSSLPAKIKMVRQFVDGKKQRHRLLYSESELARAFDDFGGMELKRIGTGCPCCFDFDAMCEVVSGGKDVSYIVDVPPVASLSRTIDCFEQEGVLSAEDQLRAHVVFDEGFIVRGEMFFRHFLQRYTDDRIRFSVFCNDHQQCRETLSAWMRASGIKGSAVLFFEEGVQFGYGSVPSGHDQWSSL